MQPDSVIAIRDLVKRYGETVAVAGIDLDIERGEIVGLLGPNGSGKTTTILALLGLTEPNGGEIRVLGLDPLREPLEVKRRVGYLPDAVGFYDAMTARQNVAYTARLAGFRGSEMRDRIDRALERVELTDVADRPVATFSRGMRQRLGLAEILAKGVEVAILDEPTAALDPHSTSEFLEMIRGLKADGVTVLLSSHHLDQVQRVCDRVALFHRGKVALCGSVAELAARVIGGGHVIELDARGDSLERRIGGVPGVARVRTIADGKYRIDVGSDVRADLVRALSGHCDILGLGFAQPSLTEIYPRYFEGERDAA